MQPLPALLAVVLLAVVHLFAWRLDFLQGTPRSRWLSLAGGVAVGYVFAHILPDLSEMQRHVEEARRDPNWYWQHHLYLVALAGLAMFYSIERSAKRTKRRNSRESGSEVASGWVFALHMAVVALYMAFIGYLLVREESKSLVALLIFSVVLGVHFAGNDRAFEHDYRRMYLRFGRWIVAAALVAGWVIGYFTEIPRLAFGVFLAVIAGGIIFTAIKEELPEERESRVLPFLAGLVLTAATLAFAAGLVE